MLQTNNSYQAGTHGAKMATEQAIKLAACKTLARRERYGETCDVTSLSLATQGSANQS